MCIVWLYKIFRDTGILNHHCRLVPTSDRKYFIYCQFKYCCFVSKSNEIYRNANLWSVPLKNELDNR